MVKVTIDCIWTSTVFTFFTCACSTRGFSGSDFSLGCFMVPT